MHDDIPKQPTAAVRRLDPTVDCLFKALLGTEANLHLLRHFLSCMVPFPDPIEELTLLNPYNEKLYREDKYGIVDVKVVDRIGRIYQIEVQAQLQIGLPERMVYHQAKICATALPEGRAYRHLPPVISIWLLTRNLFSRRRTRRALLHFRWCDAEAGLTLTRRHLIQVVQLNNLDVDDRIEGDRALWLRFFREGKNFDLDHPPAWIHTSPEMEQAMSVMQQFSQDFEQMMLYDSREKARRNSLEFQKEVAAQDRRDARKARATARRERELRKAEAARADREHMQRQAEAARAETEAARAETEAARAETEAARADREHMQRQAEAARADAAQAELARQAGELARREAEIAALRELLAKDTPHDL